MKSVLAIVLGGGAGTRLYPLTHMRSKPAVPFGGKYRIIDFSLSNCVNSGIYDVGILTQYRPLSLRDHIGIGRPWDLDRKRGGVELLQPFQGWAETDWYRGTADAIQQNWIRVEEREAEHLLVLSGDHVYRMDYRPMIEAHLASGADATIAIAQVPREEARGFGVVDLDGRHAVPLHRPTEAIDDGAARGLDAQDQRGVLAHIHRAG